MLYRYEVKGIQSFVLRSSRLRDIAAASALVAGGLDGPRDLLVERLDGKVLASAAGSATLSFPDAEQASRFAEVWPLVAGEVLPGPQVIGALAENLGGLHDGLQRSRNTPHADVYDAGPLVARAGRTGAPAVGRSRGVLQDAVHVRLAKQDEGRLDHFETMLLRGGSLEGKRFLHDNNGLGDDGYLALLHADGNNIGTHVVGLLQKGDVGAFQAFSEALHDVTVGAVRKALEDAMGSEPGDVLPVRPVVVGGDDVTLLLTPRVARSFVGAYLRAFEDGCARHDVLPGFTASAAIVFAKTKAPFYAVHDVCEALCGWVKSETGRKASAFAVHRITASPLEPFDQTRERSLSGSGAPDLFLGGPYGVREGGGLPSASVLEELLTAAGRFPRTGLREWLRVRQDDGPRADIRWNRLAEVAGSKGTWAPFARHLDRGHWASTSYSHAQRQRSPLLDVLNLIALEGKA